MICTVLYAQCWVILRALLHRRIGDENKELVVSVGLFVFNFIVFFSVNWPLEELLRQRWL